MVEPTAKGFARFFQAVYGYQPFAWQAELAERILRGDGWPSAIDVPTGLGKTAVVDLAVYALAAQATMPIDERTAATRTFVVVDRRVIVDQTYGRASELSEKLAASLAGQANGPVAEVADALRSLAGASSEPLAVVRMRGGMTWSWRWLRSPDQPAVVVGTVDQFGSRLLFRGYGVGARLRPIDAALCGSDALLILDEAHLSKPLVETAVAAHLYEATAERPVLPRRSPRPVLLSATPPVTERDVFRPHLDGEETEVARRRLAHPKQVALVDLVTRASDPRADLSRVLAAILESRLGDDGVERAAVVCNTVRVARLVFDRVRSRLGDTADCRLLIGRSREWERNRVAEWACEELGAKEDRPPRARRIVAVATQTIEVGADFDVDLLITEAAPLDSLLQRLGRLNRLGLRLAAEAVVVHCPKYHAEDPVYGKATDRAWEWLVEQAGGAAEVRPTGAASDHVGAPSVDLSSRALARLLAPDDRILYSAEPVLAPVVLGPLLDAWARTEPAPEPDQPVAPFLHGYGRGSPEVLVCWRAGLPPPTAGADESWEAELRTTPVAAQETVSVPLWEAAGFLAGRDDRDLADVESAEQPDDELEERTPVHAMILAADGSVRRIQQNRDLRPGVTVVVAAEEGGHDEWGWTGRRDPGNPVRDVADLVRRRRVRLRLRPGLLTNLLPRAQEDWEALFRHGTADDRPREESVAKQVLARIAKETLDGEAEPLRPSTLARLGEKGRFSTVYRDCFLVEGEVVIGEHGEGPKLSEQEGDEEEGSSSTAAEPVSLERHLCDVADRARDVAVRLGLATELVNAVELAARAHDLGKADSRFQVMLHRGDRLSYEASREPLAKSNMDPADRQAFRKARERSGWPKGMRHEAISAALVRPLIEDHPEVLDGVDPELVVHLVATHHGWGRPLLPPVLDPEPELVTTALPGVQATLAVRSDEGLIDWDGPARFHRLCRRYGRWGLALLEATVRLADIACSEEYRS